MKKKEKKRKLNKNVGGEKKRETTHQQNADIGNECQEPNQYADTMCMTDYKSIINELKPVNDRSQTIPFDSL